MTTPAAPIAPVTPAPPVAQPVVPDGILGALHLTLVDLNAAVLGEAGAQVKTLEQRTGTIADIVRKGVALIGQLMIALARAMEAAFNLVVGADAVFALLEVVLDTLDAMIYAVGGTVAILSGKDGAAELGDLAGLRAPLAEARAFLGDSGLVADLMPSGSDIGKVRKELAILVGSRADPKCKTTGTLGALEAAIAPPGAPGAPPAPNTPSPNASPSPGNQSSAAPGGPQGR